MPYAEFEDVRDRYDRTIPDALVTFVAVNLADASLRLDVKVPTLAARIAGGLEPALPGLATSVVCAAVIRVLRNPGGYRSEHVAERSYQYKADQSDGLSFSDDDVASLQPLGRRSRARSVGLDDDALIQPTRIPPRWPWPWQGPGLPPQAPEPDLSEENWMPEWTDPWAS